MSDLFERMWEQVRDLDEFDFRDVARRGCSEYTAIRYIRFWRKDGRICVSRIGENNKKLWRPSHKLAATPEPVSGEATPTGNMWRVMRHLRQFCPTDVAAHANAGGVQVSVEKARAYCRQLFGSGHLKVRQTAVPGQREAIYQLIGDSGPRPPRPVRLNGILDPNTGAFAPSKGGDA